MASFMQREINRGDCWAIDGPRGIDYVPDEIAWARACDTDAERWSILKRYCENEEFWTIEKMENAWYGRWSAPGYLDCTAWMACKTKKELLDALRE